MPPPVPATVPADLHDRINHETDARFAAQTGVTRKLDPHNPIDAKLVPVWLGINQVVLGELASPGGVHWTFDAPHVATALAAAKASSAAAADSLHAAATAPTAADQHAHLADAHQHARAAAQAASAAASAQPPSVNHSILAQAAHAVRNLVVHGIDDVADFAHHLERGAEQIVTPASPAQQATPVPADRSGTIATPVPADRSGTIATPDDAVAALQANAAPAHAAAAAPVVDHAPGSYPEPSRMLPPSSGPSTHTAAIIFGVAILGAAGAFAGLAHTDRNRGARRGSGRRRRR